MRRRHEATTFLSTCATYRITYRPRYRPHWHACVEGHPRDWGAGHTPESAIAAIGSLPSLPPDCYAHLIPAPSDRKDTP